MDLWLRIVVAVVISIIRSFALWVVIPVGFIAWLMSVPFTLPRPIRLGAFLGWLDLNLVVLLITPFRPFLQTPPTWLGPRQMRDVTHRIRLWDPY